MKKFSGKKEIEIPNFLMERFGLILALDVDPKKAKGVSKKLFPYTKIVKIGSQIFTASGPEMVHWLRGHRQKVFLDLKFHDIPNTVAEAVKNAVKMKVWGLTVHTLGGFAMMRETVKAAREVAQKNKIPKPLIFGVTLLTSLDEAELRRVGIFEPAEKEVVRLASLAKKAGLDGVVASGREIKTIRKACGENFLIAVAGIRFNQGKKQDQKRTITAEEAIQLGANYLIVGRPILEARDPVGTIKNMVGADDRD